MKKECKTEQKTRTHVHARTYTHTHTRAGHKSMSRCPVELPLPLCPASCTRARTTAPTKQLSKCLSKCRRGVRERHSGTDRLSGTVGRTAQVKGRDRRQAQDRIVGRIYNVFKHVKKHTHTLYILHIHSSTSLMTTHLILSFFHLFRGH